MKKSEIKDMIKEEMQALNEIKGYKKEAFDLLNKLSTIVRTHIKLTGSDYRLVQDNLNTVRQLIDSSE